MNSNEFKFLMDLMASPQERAFAAALAEDPSDQATRNAYSDYLEEHGRDDSADQVRRGFTPGGNWYYPPGTCIKSGAITSGFGVSYNWGIIRSGAIGSGQIAAYHIASGPGDLVFPPYPPLVAASGYYSPISSGAIG